MIDRIVGNYRVVERIGDGGMGSVFRAVDRMLDREVAIKVLRPELARQEALVERFRQEAIALARLSHPHIATLHGLEKHDDQLLMIMEFVRGDTLEDIVQRSGRVAWARACELCIAVLDALDHAHDKGVIHRDIKPANIMLSSSGVVKVMDFGIARMLGRSRQTKFGHAVGTPMYMAPEQLRGQEVDGRTDLYAVGAVLFELVTGRMAFEADSDYSLMMKKLNEPPVPPSQFVPDIPKMIDDIVMKAMDTLPENRYAHAVEFAETLEEAMRTLSTPMRRMTPATRLSDPNRTPRSTPVPRSTPAPNNTPVAETRLADAPASNTPVSSSQYGVAETRLADAAGSIAETRLASETPHTATTSQIEARHGGLARDWRVYAAAGAVFVAAAVGVQAWRSPSVVEASADTTSVVPVRNSDSTTRVADAGSARVREDATSLIIKNPALPPASDIGTGGGTGGGDDRSRSGGEDRNAAPPSNAKRPPATPPATPPAGSDRSGVDRTGTDRTVTVPPKTEGGSGESSGAGSSGANSTPPSEVVESASAARENIQRAIRSALSEIGSQSGADALLDGAIKSEWMALAREGRVSASASGSPDIDLQGSSASATIDANVNVRSPFGANKKRPARFAAQLQKSGGSWRVTSLRPVGSLSLK